MIQLPLYLRPCVLQNTLQIAVGCVAASEPDDPRWWAELLKQLDKIRVLGHDDRTITARGGENLLVSCVTQPKIAKRHYIEVKLLPEPGRQLWWKMRVKPELHPITTGWSTRCRA
jgi:hypothetical protein